MLTTAIKPKKKIKARRKVFELLFAADSPGRGGGGAKETYRYWRRSRIAIKKPAPQIKKPIFG